MKLSKCDSHVSDTIYMKKNVCGLDEMHGRKLHPCLEHVIYPDKLLSCTNNTADCSILDMICSFLQSSYPGETDKMHSTLMTVTNVVDEIIPHVTNENPVTDYKTPEKTDNDSNNIENNIDETKSINDSVVKPFDATSMPVAYVVSLSVASTTKSSHIEQENSMLCSTLPMIVDHNRARQYLMGIKTTDLSTLCIP